MNFTADLLSGRAADQVALVAIARDGSRREYRFGELDDLAARFAGTLAARRVRKGSVVMTVTTTRPEWVIALLAAFRIGAVALPCVAQSRAKDLARRVAIAQPDVIVATEESAAAVAASGADCPVLLLPDEGLYDAVPAPAAEMQPEDPAMMIFTSGTSGEPKAVVHGVRYLFGQQLQATHWLDARAGDLVWCTAAAGWSKSARNAFIAPWLRGARALVHDARFDPAERLEILRRERVDVLCMAPTEYRMVLRRTAGERLPHLRSAVAAGEKLDAETILHWRDVTGVALRDGYGQTETGAVTAIRPDDAPRPGSMGRPLPGLRTTIVDGQLHLDPRSSPTFCLGYHGEEPIIGTWATGDLVDEDEEGFLWFRGRADDVIISAGYRVGPTEVEEALLGHRAIAEAAVVGHPDAERGEVVRAVVVLDDDWAASPELVRELQDHVKAQTAPYKYPRVVDFAAALPRTASGKVRRAELRKQR
jgi:acyl-coenzyme A synthetase/AMP-(fatty) acid ligase